MASRKVTLKDESGHSVTYSYTDRQLSFVEHYLNTFNGTESARLAKYTGSDNVLGVTAYDNLRKPKIALLIKHRLAAECMSATETMRHLAFMARGVDVTKYVTVEIVEDDEGNKRQVRSFDIDKLRDDGLGHLIKSITPLRSGLKIEFYDRLGALNSIAKHHALFTDVIINANVDESDKELLTDAERQQFAADVLGRITRRSE